MSRQDPNPLQSELWNVRVFTISAFPRSMGNASGRSRHLLLTIALLLGRTGDMDVVKSQCPFLALYKSIFVHGILSIHLIYGQSPRIAEEPP
jgi:hypothetical protein